MGQQLGKAISIMMRFEARENMMHEDLNGFYAPSECHDQVAKGSIRRARQAIRHARSVSGVTKGKLKKALAQITPRQQNRLMEACCDRIDPYRKHMA